MSGRATAIPVTLAAAIEQALDVDGGELFEVTERADLVQPYVTPTRGAA